MVLVRVSQNVSYKVFETLSKIKDLEFENKQQAVDKLKDLGLNDRELFEVVFIPVEEAIKSGKTTIKISVKEL